VTLEVAKLDAASESRYTWDGPAAYTTYGRILSPSVAVTRQLAGLDDCQRVHLPTLRNTI